MVKIDPMEQNAIRVAIVEDDAELLELLRKRIDRAEGMRVVRTFLSGDDFSFGLKDLDTDVVLMDINMPGTSGIDCVSSAKPLKPEIQYLMLTVFENPGYILEALCAGATGYLVKSTMADELIDAIREIHSGGSPMSGTIARLVVDRLQQGTPQRINDNDLTKREREVLDGLAAGLKYREIAAKTNISTETVRVHVRSIYSKLQVNGRMAAVKKVFPKGL